MKKGKAVRPPTPNYNYGLERQVRVIEGPSLTRQSEAASCDVNDIVRRYDRTGLLTHLQSAEAVFADVSDVGSYSEAVQTVFEAQKAFLELPSGLRAHFGNDPAAYVDWATQASTQDKADLYAALTGADRYADPSADPPASPPADGDQPSE